MRSRLFASLAAVAVLAACGWPAEASDDAAPVVLSAVESDEHQEGTPREERGETVPPLDADPLAGERAPSDPEPAAPVSVLCAVTYSPETLRERSFAFDGTVVDVRIAFDPRAPAGDLVTGHVRFEVHRWFGGGSGETVDVWMQRPVEEGDRLLVAGAPRWGGTPLEDAIAWECGFTSAYSEARSEEWSTALADG